MKKCSARKYPDAGDLQDFTQKPIMVGGDVVGLYPNMDIVATAELSARAMVESDIHVKGVDFKALAVYLFLVLGPVTMVNLGLGHCVPYRLIKSSANSLAASSNRELNNWRLDVDTLRDSDKRLLLAQMLKIGNLVAMESDTSTSNTSESLLSDVSQFEPVKRSPTNLSNDLDRNKITPDKPESKSLELKRVAETTQRWEVAAAGRGLIRFRSLPDGLDKLTENPFFSGYPRARSYSVSDMGLSTCSWSIDRKTVNKL